MAIKRFEDIRGWQEARALTKQICSLRKVSPGLRRDRRLRDQIQAASVSIMSNIAKGSAAEVQSLLYVAVDQEYVSDTEFSTLYAKADEVARIPSGFITSLLRRSTRSSTQ
jgi:hypothetical protein